MANFLAAVAKNTRTLVEVNIPEVSAFVPSKVFFEVLYNRLFNDLVLWVPAAPTPLDAQDPYGLMTGGLYPPSTWSPDLYAPLFRQPPEMYAFCNTGNQYGM